MENLKVQVQGQRLVLLGLGPAPGAAITSVSG